MAWNPAYSRTAAAGDNPTAYSGLPKNPSMGRFSNSGIYAPNQEYTIDIPLSVGDHTFTPKDSRRRNWAGGTWWITEKVDEDAEVCGGGDVCDGQGDGPCDCDPCPACNGPEIARGGTEEDLMQDVPQTFTVPAPDYLVAAFGPGCGRRDRYQDFNVYRHLVTLQAGTYVFHSGGKLWDSANVDPSLPMDASYWEVFNNATGDLVAGGPGDGAQRSDEGSEGIQMLTIPSTGAYEVVIHTFQTSGINWAITSDFTLLGDDIRRCDPTVYTLHVRTGGSGAWAISWEIDAGENPYGLDDLYSGPHRRPIYMGGLPTRDGGGRVRRDEYFEGSIAQLVLLRAPLDTEEADCLFRSGEGNLGVCPTIEEMRGGRDWFGTFLGDSTNRIASRDLAGSRQAMSESWDEEHTLQDAITTCAQICSQQGYAYMGWWANECWCDNDYGSKGSAEAGRRGHDHSANGSVPPRMSRGTGRDGVWTAQCGLLPERDRRCMIARRRSRVQPYLRRMFRRSDHPDGHLFGDAIDDQEENFGVRLDGEGDYLTIDSMSQYKTDAADSVPKTMDGEFDLGFGSALVAPPACGSTCIRTRTTPQAYTTSLRLSALTARFRLTRSRAQHGQRSAPSSAARRRGRHGFAPTQSCMEQMAPFLIRSAWNACRTTGANTAATIPLNCRGWFPLRTSTLSKSMATCTRLATPCLFALTTPGTATWTFIVR